MQPCEKCSYNTIMRYPVYIKGAMVLLCYSCYMEFKEEEDALSMPSNED